jgi:hypothetical protein
MGPEAESADLVANRDTGLNGLGPTLILRNRSRYPTLRCIASARLERTGLPASTRFPR